MSIADANHMRAACGAMSAMRLVAKSKKNRAEKNHIAVRGRVEVHPGQYVQSSATARNMAGTSLVLFR